MTDVDNGSSVFKVSLWRRLAYPGVAIACAGFAVYQHGMEASGEFPDLFYVVAAGAVLLFLYINSIHLVITPTELALRWPLVEAKVIKWDDIAQIRRSSASPGRSFYIDLIATPDHSVQFNPFMFDRPWEIIEKLNKHLDSDLFKEDRLPEMHGEVIAAEENDAVLSPNWVLWAMGLIVALLFVMLLLR